MKVKIRIGNEVKEYTGAWEDHTLLEVFQELGITQVHAPCGGNGTCKKCLVKSCHARRNVKMTCV